MRLSPPSRLSLFLPCALAAVLLLRQAPAAALVADEQLSCAGLAGHAFPLTTRIHGGPGSYKPGGADETWFIDLTNKTAESCKNVHPVVVLVDSQHKLRDAEPKLEFLGGGRWHPVTFTHTDRQELVGTFDDGFSGFTVGPSRTRSVKVRFGLTDEARPNDIVAKAAIAQKKGGDGDWAGESDNYWFRVEAGGAATAELTGKTPDPTGETPAPKRKTPGPSDEATAPTGKSTAPKGKPPGPSDEATAPTGTSTAAPDKANGPTGTAAHPTGKASGQSDKGHALRPADKASPAPGSTATAGARATTAASPPSRDLVKFVGGVAMAATGLLVAGGSLVMARRRR
ncbi:hypothetical protein ACWD5Q_22420 [Streptomyces sp. NPDC002513]